MNMLNYQRHTSYSCNTLNASYNANNMSPLTTSSTPSMVNSHCNGPNLNNMMDNAAYFNSGATYQPMMNCNVTPCFNEKQMGPHSIAMDYDNANAPYLDTNQVQMNAVQSSNYYPYSSSSANTSCRSSCDESVCNDNNNYIQGQSQPWFYPNEPLVNHMFSPDIKTELVPHNTNNNAACAANNYYAPCTNYTKPACDLASNTSTNAYESNVSLMPLMNMGTNQAVNSNNVNNTYYASHSYDNNNQFNPPLYNQQEAHLQGKHNNISLKNRVLSIPQIKPESNTVSNNVNNERPHAVNNNNAFVKHNHFIYPSYQQKYAQNASTPHFDIKQELYRSRRQTRYNQHIKVQIKGSNFETLVKKLTRGGDNTRCIECNKSFLQKCHLFRHIRDCHLTKTAVHECPFCPKSFHQKSNLDTHCMTHAKDRKFSHPFRCLICAKEGKDKAFTRKSSLKRHCQAKHKHISVESDWINNQQTPKWDQSLKTFVFNPSKTKRNKQ